jgi:hypothetical protein
MTGYSTPTFREVVEAYKIDSLRTGGDLQLTASGSIALTADSRDLKFGNDKHNALHRLVRGWCVNAKTLQVLFEVVATAQSTKIRAENERNNLAGIAFTSPSLTAQFHALGDDIGASAYGGAACAGAMVVVLSNVLMRFKNDLNATGHDWQTAAPLIEGCSFGSIVVAGGNNFRHHDEWAHDNPPSQRQLNSIKVIAAVLKESIAANGDGHPFRHNICAEVIGALSGGSFDTLSQRFFGFAKTMAA